MAVKRITRIGEVSGDEHHKVTVGSLDDSAAGDILCDAFIVITDDQGNTRHIPCYDNTA